jgi:2-dehydro-3-deoxygalactonokinase
LPETLPDAPDPDAEAAGARAVASGGLGRAAFLVRIAALTQALDPVERASFWIGAIVAADVISLAGHAILAPGRPIWVGGRQPLRRLYTTGLSQQHQGPVISLDDSLAESASALGALEIAERRIHIDQSLRPE